MASTAPAPIKRVLKDMLNGEKLSITVAAKKPKITKLNDARTKDIQTIKSILGDITDPCIKTALLTIVSDPTKAAKTSSVTTTTPKKSEAALDKLTKQTIRTIQQSLNEKLKWKSSYKKLKDGSTKGGRAEVVCTDPDVFQRIFDGATIKTAKDGKLSCSIKTEEDANKWDVPFKGKSYRYNSAELCPPYSASLKDDTLTFSYKFMIW